jgi:diguanylate cyclase
MERSRTLSLRARLLLLVLMGAIPALVIIIYTTVSQRQAAVEAAARDAQNVVNLAVREQNQLILITGALLADLARIQVLADPSRAGRCTEIMAQTKRVHPYFANLGVAGSDGEVYCSAMPMKRPVNIADRSYFQRALASRGLGIGDYQIGRIVGVITLNIGYPVTNADGHVVGVVYAAIDVSWINQLLTKTELSPDSMVAILDSAGTVFAHHPEPERWLGQSLRGSPLMKAILASQGEGTVGVTGFGDAPMLFAFAPLDKGPGGTIYVVAGTSAALVDRSVRKVLYRNLLLLVVAALLGVAAAWFGSHWFVLRRMDPLAKAAARLGEGELSARTGLAHDNDEFGSLARTFDSMAEGLERRQREVARSTRALRALTAATRTLVRASNEQDLLETMCRVVVRVGNYSVAVVVYALDDAEKNLDLVAQTGMDADTMARLAKYPRGSWADNERGRDPLGTAVRTNAPVVVRDMLNDPGHAPWRAEIKAMGHNATAAFPLTVEGRVVGAIGIYSQEADAFDAEEMRLLEEMADDLSYGISMQRTRAEHARANETIRRMAYYDPLTDLPNHAQLEVLLKQTVEEAERDDTQTALLLIDINGFREINEAVGIHQANMVLKEIGPRIRALAGEHDIIARMRGDEFAVLLPRADVDSAVRMADRIRRVLNVRFVLGSVSLDVNVSIGIVLTPHHGREIEALVRRADTALYHARRSGNGYAVYDSTQDKNTSQRLALAADLREAIEAEAIELYYQPQMDMTTGLISGFEALARWRHTTHGMIPPDQFIPLAESTGLIGPLTERLLDQAVRHAQALAEHGIRLPVSVNLSARNLHDDLLFEKIKNVRDSFPERRMLELEITESALMVDPTHSLEVLTKLHLLGIRLYIDDFGTGYSSLAYLQKLPVDAIKVDKSFVIDMLRSKDSATIVHSVISLAHDLGLRVVAEGVETEPALVRLQALGCDVAQGYYLAKPMPADQVAEWMSAWSPKPAKKKLPAARVRRVDRA